MFIGIIFYLY
jgi:hypothetical protein